MAALAKTKMSLEEYLEFDFSAEGRFEYFDGKVFEMGASPEHSEIQSSLNAILRSKTILKGCKVYTSELGVKVPKLLPYRYPDLTVVCGNPEFEEIGGLRRLLNPVLIVEVLSDSTEKFDKGEKFTAYKSIPSLKEYLLISQHKKFVTLYTKYNEKFWFQSEYESGETLKLESLECELNVDEIYAGITFELE
jgi:Uma2 family endonuclease